MMLSNCKIVLLSVVVLLLTVINEIYIDTVIGFTTIAPKWSSSGRSLPGKYRYDASQQHPQSLSCNQKIHLHHAAVSVVDDEMQPLDDDDDDDGEQLPVIVTTNEDIIEQDADENDDDNDVDDYMKTIDTLKIPTFSSPKWEMYNTFHDFINQCTIQSFTFILHNCIHDIYTTQYVENFTQPMIDTPIIRTSSTTSSSNTNTGPLLLNYHGIHAMNKTAFPTWDTYYTALLQQPYQSLLIESYQKHVPSYELDINPASLCHRILSVREQIANEMVHDLNIITQMIPKITKTTITTSNDKSNKNYGPSRSLLAMDDVLFLDTWDASDGDYNMPSPLRKGNFDLLLLYITQESIHRILNENEIGNSDDNNYGHDNRNMLSQDEEQLLSNFYLHRIVTHFTGRQKYGRANQFLQELLDSGNINNDNDDFNDDGMVCTERIVLHILRTRQRVAMEYSQIAASIPSLHMPIKKLQLNLLMQSYGGTGNNNNNNNNNNNAATTASNEFQ